MMTDNPDLCDHWRIDRLLVQLDHDQWSTRQVKALLAVDPLAGLEASLRAAVGPANCALHDDYDQDWLDVAEQERTAHISTWCEALYWIARIRAEWGRRCPGKIWELRLRLYRAALERLDGAKETPMGARERWEERRIAGAARVEARRKDLVIDRVRYVIEALIEEGGIDPDDAEQLLAILNKNST